VRCLGEVGQAVDFLEGEAKKLPAGFGRLSWPTPANMSEGNQLAITFASR